jgi:hypothetical protein
MPKEYGLHVGIIEHVKNTYKGRPNYFNNFLDQTWKETRMVSKWRLNIHFLQMLEVQQNHDCHNPSLVLTTKARACKGLSQKWSLGITFHAPKSVRKCEGMNPTFPSELPLWELESRWTSKSSKGDYKGQNSLDWRLPYIIGNLLKFTCMKWACMTLLRNKSISYSQKKGRESNWQFDSQPLKLGTAPIYLCKGGVLHIIGKLLKMATTLL